jgi:hypothetical protein
MRRKITLSIEETQLERLDKARKKWGLTRSAFLVNAANTHIMFLEGKLNLSNPEDAIAQYAIQEDIKQLEKRLEAKIEQKQMIHDSIYSKLEQLPRTEVPNGTIKEKIIDYLEKYGPLDNTDITKLIELDEAVTFSILSSMDEVFLNDEYLWELKNDKESESTKK